MGIRLNGGMVFSISKGRDVVFSADSFWVPLILAVWAALIFLNQSQVRCLLEGVV